MSFCRVESTFLAHSLLGGRHNKSWRVLWWLYWCILTKLCQKWTKWRSCYPTKVCKVCNIVVQVTCFQIIFSPNFSAWSFSHLQKWTSPLSVSQSEPFFWLPGSAVGLRFSCVRLELFLPDTFVMAEENLSAVLYSPGDLRLVGEKTKTWFVSFFF